MTIQYNDYIKTEAWRQRAEAAKGRAGHRCQICNRASPRVTLTVHHRTFERLGQEQPEDLTVLCRGCYELYEKNRRMPTPSAAPSTSTTAQTDKPNKLRRPPLAEPARQRFFTPVRTGQQVAEENGHNGHQEEPVVLLTVDQVYTLETSNQPAGGVEIFALSPAPGNSPAAALYQLAGEQTPQPASQPEAIQPIGIQLLGLLLIVCLVTLSSFALYEFAPESAALLPSVVAPTVVTPPEENRAPAISTAVTTTVVTTVATPTNAPIVAPTVTSVPPITTPTLLPPTPLPPTPLPPTPLPTNIPPTVAPTPTDPPPTVAPAPQSSMIRTALVCQNPCSCAPIVRTIPQGTQVAVLQTQLCSGDVWYQIGEDEWLGPGVVDTK